MLLGAVLTKAWVPNPCDINGNPRSLEELGKGKVARLRMEREEKEQQAASVEMRAG
jgi:PHS family inorganic phosphate transporter-like MFS transporter